MRKKIVAGNWKMNMNMKESNDFVSKLSKVSFDNVDVKLAPSFTNLYHINSMLDSSKIEVISQNMHYEQKGAYTGEISASMLKDIGCKYVLIGHSERRVLMKESNDIISEKFNTAIAHDLIPILCVGETINEREQGLTKTVIQNQIDIATQGYDFKKKACFVIAYEPIWAIGTGIEADSQNISSAVTIPYQTQATTSLKSESMSRVAAPRGSLDISS